MQLIQYTPGETQRFNTPTSELASIPTPDAPPQSPAWISLHLLESGQILPVSDRIEFTMGRVSENQPIMPDIDLSPFKAFDNGVSRLHAVIRNHSGNIIIMDLGSSNGTYINGTRIVPNIEQPLRHGDIVALGKLKMQVVLS
ncbi:MAG: hypothetical protein Fur0016_20000 [Anaerolineales bacterium]